MLVNQLTLPEAGQLNEKARLRFKIGKVAWRRSVNVSLGIVPLAKMSSACLLNAAWFANPIFGRPARDMQGSSLIS